MRETLSLSHAIHLMGWILFAAGCWHEVYLAMAVGKIVALMNIVWIYMPILVNLAVVSALAGAGFVARKVTGGVLHFAMAAVFLLVAQVYHTGRWLPGVAAH